MLKIAIIEDYVIFRLGLKNILELHFDGVATFDADHSDGYMEELAKFTPDLIIMGLGVANEPSRGLSFCRDVKKRFTTVPVIVFDMVATYGNAVNLIKGGANGYLSKGDNELELLTCIESVMKGKNYVCREIQENIIEYLILDKPSSRSHANLSARESEIASLVSEGEKTSFIAEKLGLKSSTVSTMKSKIFSKLGVHNVIELRHKMKVSMYSHMN
jgi:two-component system invasion response regulator UvrY